MNTDKVKGAMFSAGYKTMEDGAKSLGMPYSTFCFKMKNESFTVADAQNMVITWDIKHPEEVFFDQNSTSKVTKEV